MPFHVEHSAKEQRAYESLLVDNPKLFTILGSDLARKIVSALAEQPSSAMDVARKLKQHEQKIYYHFRNLESAGIIKLIKTEERVGALAKIYAAQFPVVSFKLFEGNQIIDAKTRVRELKFFDPFFKAGKLDSRIIVGSPDPHGKWGAQASDGLGAIDLALFLGTLSKETQLPNYKMDTQVKDEDLKHNLIVVGGPKANLIVERVNKSLPIYFDYHREWNVVSPFSKQIYNEDEVGIVAKMKNPFNEKKQILVLAGKRFRGTRGTIIAVIKYLDEIEKGNKYDPSVIAKVVQSIDRDGDGIFDDVRFLE